MSAARLALIAALVLVLGCGGAQHRPAVFVSDLEMLTNWPADSDGVKRLSLDYRGAKWDGFSIPSAWQVPHGRFSFQFRVKDPEGKARAFRYKLYWRNETYKFQEADADGDQHPNAQENFYGSWNNAGEGFRLTPPTTSPEGVLVTDSFNIRGDPRDEPAITENGKRARWGRNPRVGEYSFLLVVMPEETASTLPTTVTDIRTLLDSSYVEPYWYFLHGPGARMPDVQVLLAEDHLSVSAHPDLRTGVYVPNDTLSKAAFCSTCGQSELLQTNAPFEQLIHYVHTTTRFSNIPVIADVLGNEWTPTDHDRYRCFFPEKDMLSLKPMTTRMPCENVHVDSVRGAIELRNPASTYGHWRKENTGIRTRHTFTYGRFRVHCKLTRLLNDSDMWVGLTNAIWLIGDGQPWDLRRVCEGGYMANYYGGDDDVRIPRSSYAEIDFEILKTPPYCPERSFPPVYPQQVADASDRANWSRVMPEQILDARGKITVACTNWDMACPAPPAFDAGCQAIEKNGQIFYNHRWDHKYRAVTQKTLELDSVLFGPNGYWFEIDWRPEEIFWRIGATPDDMRVVGYMNSTMTEIANVPMDLLISQEFHNTRWWPGSTYEQGYIPFPAKDYVGEVYEVIIE